MHCFLFLQLTQLKTIIVWNDIITSELLLDSPSSF